MGGPSHRRNLGRNRLAVPVPYANTGTCIGLLVICRQIVALAENRRVNARLRATILELLERDWKLQEQLRRDLKTADRTRRQPASR